MLNYVNPIHGDVAEQGGKKYSYDGNVGAWKQLEEKIVPDVSGSADVPISKVWSGTYAEYQAIPVKQDDTIYFIKD